MLSPDSDTEFYRGLYRHFMGCIRHSQASHKAFSGEAPGAHVCKSSCTFIHVTHDHLEIFYCVGHANVHYCGPDECSLRLYDADGCSCPLTAVQFSGLSVMDDGTSGARYYNKKDSDAEKKTRAVPAEYARLDKWTAAHKQKRLPTTRDDMHTRCLRDNLQRLGRGVLNGIRKRKGLPVDPESDSDVDDVAVTAASKKKPPAPSTVKPEKQVVTAEMSSKRRRLFGNNDASKTAPAAAAVAVPVPSTKQIEFGQSVITLHTKRAPKAAQISQRIKKDEFVGEAQRLLKHCIDSDARRRFDPTSRHKVTLEESVWFGNVCQSLWISLIQTQAFSAKPHSFLYPYVCLFVLLTATREGFSYYANGDKTQTKRIEPRPDLLAKAPKVSRIPSIGYLRDGFTNSRFTAHQRCIKGAFHIGNTQPEEDGDDDNSSGSDLDSDSDSLTSDLNCVF